ncbi:ferrochelatase [Haloactinopolyspora alba]|uniref:Coproporphyrin III ferrochelatase n=1 Tax=Haloactinopolyspora alba TaxID=648780 RepID=A0A2P8E2P1_9ACTN|nr:ferrochelatase [Haloactinopolyspora alba]PSL03716.1 ferrochelatase [Haloactinopolyspora alba]
MSETRNRVDPYDALLVVSFGGPESDDDVMPFLENVTRGRGVPRERLEEVAEHYYEFGGRSPINAQNRALVANIEHLLAEIGISMPVYWGNRNWDPYLADELTRMRDNGIGRAAVFITSAYDSYSGCRQYREDLADAVAAVGPGAPRLDRLRHSFDHPGFITANADGVVGALGDLPAQLTGRARIVFVTHSIPVAMAETSGPSGGAYVAQHEAVAEAVAAQVAERTGVQRPFDLVYCSRSGPPEMPWLEPDVNDHLASLAADGVEAVILAPIGFLSDHMEVAYDLDTEAIATAKELGVAAARAATAGTHPDFVATVVDLLTERAAVERGEDVTRASVLSLGPAPDVCPAGCCPNLRESRPALFGEDAPPHPSP